MLERLPGLDWVEVLFRDGARISAVDGMIPEQNIDPNIEL
jgi:hypothetical protein